MLAEYGLIPDVFEPASYSSAEVCDLRLARLKDGLLQCGLVRDFREGEWRTFVRDRMDRWDKRAKELVRKLIDQKRLVRAPSAGPERPTDAIQWCSEAVASHGTSALTGIITGPQTAERFVGEEVVKSIERLDTAAWWTQDRQSVRPRRATSDYLRHLELVLKHANFLMFLDAHLDPSKDRYSQFVQLLLASKRPPDAAPARIEIHRACSEGQHEVPSMAHWQSAFQVLQIPLMNAGLTAEVFVWDEMHDRFLISDLIGIQMGNGFDVSRRQSAQTTWSRISRDVRVNLQREFDFPNNVLHRLHGKFTVGLAA